MRLQLPSSVDNLAKFSRTIRSRKAVSGPERTSLHQALSTGPELSDAA